MSTSDTTDHARGWLYAEGLLLEDEIARLEAMSEEAVDAELAAGGIDPGRVPSLEAFLARAGALAKRAERADVDHARGWAHVERLLAKDEAAAHHAEKVPSLEQLLARATELANEPPPIEAGVARAVDASAPEEVMGAKVRRPVWGQRPVWLAAAVLGAMLLVFAFMNGAALVAVFEGQAIRPDDEWLPWKPARTPTERAASLRDEALAACDLAQWAACGAKLDRATGLDPAGESAPRVVAARRAIARVARPPTPDLAPSDKPTPAP